MHRNLILIALFVAVPANAQVTDAPTLQRYLAAMQEARDARANEVVIAKAEIARLNDEITKMKKCSE
jgi:outer membrane murein-binding lipoprotein Lpp